MAQAGRAGKNSPIQTGFAARVAPPAFTAFGLMTGSGRIIR
jgi:hypothetical protein